ncbi:MAG: serine/threonine protein kinase [Deltaproteobacteria bacterium]|nr:MAG: serine/threonine protein kinase [Deltaproteobacteria bacterium]
MSDLSGQKVENYKIIESIGVGGMGEVYKAIHETLDRVVALKVIHPELLSNAEIIKRFYKEAKIQAQMTHPNIVTVFDFLEIENSYFLVMEYIEGESIGKIVKKQGPLEINFSLNIFKQILSGIAHAHSKGIIHRDIKPNNFILTKGEVKITDFGIAHIVSDSAHTVAGTVLGTPKYMSPEQILGERVDHRSDVYSLGVSFYEILTGKVPFGSNTNSDYEIKKGHVELTPTSICEIRPDVSKDLENAIARSLAKKPEARFQTVDDFLASLKIGVSSDLSININTINSSETTAPNLYTDDTTSGSGSHIGFEDLDEYDEKGEIEKRFFSQILCLFYREKKTGILYVDSDIELKIYFLQGNIVFLHGSNLRYALAELLVNQSIITREEQQTAIAFANERDIKIGEALIKMGKISPHQLSSVLEDQIRKRLVEGFCLLNGKFYYKDTNMLNLEVMYNIHPLQVIYDAVERSVIEDQQISSLLKKDGTILSRRWGLAQDIATLKFSSTKELKLANLIKKAKTVGDLIEISPLDKENTRKFIFFLHLAEFIDLNDEHSEDENVENIIKIEKNLYTDAEDLEEVLESDILDNEDSVGTAATSKPPEKSSPDDIRLDDIKIEINFPGIKQETKQDSDGKDIGISQKANDIDYQGEKTKVLSSEEIEKIRSEVSGFSQKLEGDNIENLNIDHKPQQLDNNVEISTPTTKTGSDEIKLEISLPGLKDESQGGGSVVKETLSHKDNQIDAAEKKFSEEDTQILTEEDIEQLRKLTIKDYKD